MVNKKLSLSKQLFYKLKIHNIDSCANNDALFIEHNNKYYKLEPVEITLEQYLEVWNKLTGVKTNESR